MSRPELSQRPLPAGPGEIVACFGDLLPRAVCSQAAFADALGYLHGLDRDVASFHYFIEWNLRSGELDLTFTFPTRFAKAARIPFWDLARSLGRGECLVDGMCERLRALPLDAAHFPRAVSYSLGPIPHTRRGAAVELVFLDFGPALDLRADPGLLRRAFELIEPGRDIPDALERMSAGLALAHVGAGQRKGAPLHKAYLAGCLDELVGAAFARGAAPLIGRRVRDLESLASAAGPRTAHLVVDVASGSLTRVGFELNFHLDGAAGFAALAVADPLWREAVSAEWRRDAERLIELDTLFRPLDDGSHARFRISHLKLSFDRSGEPEWKAYLCFQRSLAAG